MRRATASILFVLVLGASLSAKTFALGARPGPAEAATGSDLSQFLSQRGFDLTRSPPRSAPAWIIGTRGDCRVRIADMAAEGWTRAIAAEQAAGEQILFAFDGRFYDRQPVWHTRLAKYRRRLLRYFGVALPPAPVRVLTVSNGCPGGTIRPADAVALSD